MEPPPVPPPKRRDIKHARSAPALSSGTDVTMSVPGEPLSEDPPVEEPAPTKPNYSYKDYSPEPIMVYTRSVEEANDHLPLLRGPLGFDMEWKVVYRRQQACRPTAVVQICDERYIWVIQLSAMRRCKSRSNVQSPDVRELNLCLGFPLALKKILENPDVPKIGVNIRSGYPFCCLVPPDPAKFTLDS